MAILFPTSLANLVVEVGTRHSHQILFSDANLVLVGFPEPTLLVKTCLLTTETCLIYSLVTQQPFSIPYWNLDMCIFVTSAISIFHHTVASVIVWAVLSHACHGSHVAIASIWTASTTSSIHRGSSSMKRASPIHGGRWLVQTNYEALMTHHTTENCHIYIRTLLPEWGV